MYLLINIDMSCLLRTQHTPYMNSNGFTSIITVPFSSSLFSGSYFTATPQSLCSKFTGSIPSILASPVAWLMQLGIKGPLNTNGNVAF